MATDQLKWTKRLTCVVLFVAAATLGGCGTQPYHGHSLSLMGSTVSPATVRRMAVEPAPQQLASAEYATLASPLLAATCSPAFRMVDRPASLESAAEPPTLARAGSKSATWHPLPLMMATSSPAFLHRARALELLFIAAADERTVSAPDAAIKDSEPDASVIQTDAN
jgi:hypothetical protein